MDNKRKVLNFSDKSGIMPEEHHNNLHNIPLIDAIIPEHLQI